MISIHQYLETIRVAKLLFDFCTFIDLLNNNAHDMNKGITHGPIVVNKRRFTYV